MTDRATLNAAADHMEAYMRRLASGPPPKDYGGAPVNRVEYAADEIMLLKRFTATMAAAFRSGMIDIEKDWPK